MFKVFKNISLSIFSDIFQKGNIRSDYCKPSQFSISNVRSVYNGSEIFFYLDLKIWNNVFSKLEDLTAVGVFKRMIKQ